MYLQPPIEEASSASFGGGPYNQYMYICIYEYMYICIYVYMYICTPYVNQDREAESTAGWRSSPLRHGDVIARMLARGHQVNPLLQAPWVKTSIFRRDWLHASDQGVGAELLGNLFQHTHHKYPGANKEERYAALFQDTRQFYEDEQVPDRLDCLLPTFVEKD